MQEEEGAEDARDDFGRQREQLEEAVVRAESESGSLLGGDAPGRGARLAEALTALANLCARQATTLRRQLPEHPTHSPDEEHAIERINALHLEASGLYARAMQIDPSATRATSITLCVWQAPPSPSLSFRTIAHEDEDTSGVREKEEGDDHPSEEDDEDDEDDDEEDEMMRDEVQERHMFDLARRQYEEHLHTSADLRIMMRYARMLVHRMEERAREYNEGEQAAILARAAALLGQVQQQRGQDDPSAGLAHDATSYLQRVESLIKNKRTRPPS